MCRCTGPCGDAARCSAVGLHASVRGYFMELHHVQTHLAHYTPTTITTPDFSQAAVAVILRDTPDGAVALVIQLSLIHI